MMYMDDKAYSTINTARSALSCLGLKFDGVAVGAHPTITRLMKGIFNHRPSRSKHDTTWDVDVVLNYIRQNPQNTELQIKDLTLKLTMLLALTQAARPQTLNCLTTENHIKTPESYTLYLDGTLKHTRPGMPLPPVTIKRFRADPNLCAYSCLEIYLERTQEWRENSGKLLLSYVKPHKSVTVDTIRRWLKTIMSNSGINVELFGAYSARAASVSKAACNSIPIDIIMKTAGWTRESTFAKFYHKTIVKPIEFGNNILTM